MQEVQGAALHMTVTVSVEGSKWWGKACPNL